MTNEECFDVWAPESAIWSPWAKPVLFADPNVLAWGAMPVDEVPAGDYGWLSSLSRNRAVIVDLPGVQSVATGIALGTRGFRPVPLYNTSVGPSSLLDVAPIVRALKNGAQNLRDIPLAPDAPPAFLLDAQRMRPPVAASPGKFDNRWLAFPQDFPSGMFLRTRGITEAVILHDGKGLQDDLVHVLLRWQAAGIRILSAGPGESIARDCAVRAPSWFNRLWYRVIALSRLRRNSAGGFGAVVPTPGGGHG
jgi:hypothetical protein